MRVIAKTIKLTAYSYMYMYRQTATIAEDFDCDDGARLVYPSYYLSPTYHP